MKKKSLALVAIILCLSSLIVFCLTNHMSIPQMMELIRLKNALPATSAVKFSDGEFHIFAEDISVVYKELKIDTRSNTTTEPVYAPDGGSFLISGTSQAYTASQVYMPRGIARLVTLKLRNGGNIIAHIYNEYMLGKSISDIITSARNAFGVDLTGTLTQETLSFVVGTLYNATVNYDENMMIDAYLATYEGKVCVSRISSPDVGVYNLYYAWEGNYCSAEFGATATWHGGTYDVAY
ncbi:MAG: hypothetical protein E7218_05570 [Anaerofustis stercorihominis]|nr:hypothetical protein [Anaerofustis stercorihominis]